MQSFYPFRHIGYNTLVGSPSLKQYCYDQSCQNNVTHIYNKEYTEMQKEQYKRGFNNWINHQQIQLDHLPALPPVFMSNMAPLNTNYLKYSF